MAETITMPKLGFDMAEGILNRWVRQVGETINKGDVLAEIETDKATVEVSSTATGVVLQHLVDPGAVVPVNAPIAVIGQPGESVEPVAKPAETATKKQAAEVKAPARTETTQAEPAPVQQETPTTGTVKASPLARRIAHEKNINLATLHGSGPGGRIVRKDVESAQAGGQERAASRPTTSPSAQPVIVSHEDKVVKITKLRQAIGRRMTESRTTIPHFYVTREFNVDSLLEIRRQMNGFIPEDEKVSVNDFVLKATALTLRQFPNLNSALRGTDVVQFGHVNLGVAVTVPGGLMTVVVRDTDQKTVRQISMEVKAMAARARDGKVKPEDVDGSTFSTSNLGMYGVEDFIAIINPPEAAILAISAARELPVIDKGIVRPGWRMKATVSVDHRISDGAEAAQFMQALADFLENPARLLI
jgi:pyruvate dehydrogenase E2 component (dihydrolipoamide acetyltransferase)